MTRWTMTATISLGHEDEMLRGLVYRSGGGGGRASTTTSMKSAKCTTIREKNVLYIRATVEEIVKRMGLTAEQIEALLDRLQSGRGMPPDSCGRPLM